MKHMALTNPEIKRISQSHEAQEAFCDNLQMYSPDALATYIALTVSSGKRKSALKIVDSLQTLIDMRKEDEFDHPVVSTIRMNGTQK